MMFNDYRRTFNEILVQMPTGHIKDAISYLRAFSNIVYVVGNGGSLSLANHFAQDLCKQCGISAIALTDASIISAYANDENFNDIFVRQLECHMADGDCLVAFSSSGNSEDVYRACKKAMEYHAGTRVISFTGFSGGVIKTASDISIHVPSDNYGIVETAHSLIFHYIVENIKHA